MKYEILVALFWCKNHYKNNDCYFEWRCEQIAEFYNYSCAINLINQVLDSRIICQNQLKRYLDV